MINLRLCCLLALAGGGLLFPGFCQSDSVQAGSRKPVIAVFPCMAGDGVIVTEVSFITEKVTLEILRQGQRAVIDKYEIAKRAGIRFMEAFDTIATSRTYFDLGQKCGVDQILWGKLARNGANLQLDLYLGDARTRQQQDAGSTSIFGSTLELAEQVPQLLGRLFHLAVTTYASATSGGAPQVVYAPIKVVRPVKLTVNSVPEGARVFLNGTEAGVTPFTRDSVKAGIYDCRLEKYGFLTFSEQILVQQNQDKTMTAYLEKAFGSLTVNSVPPAAAVTLSNGVAGRTPFTCDTLRPGVLTVKFVLEGYAPCSTTVTIVRKKNDTVTMPLVSLKYLDSLKRVARLRNQFIRRIGFGSLAAGAAVTGLVFNIRAGGALDDERSAYDAYRRLDAGNTAAEFNAAYDRVEESREKVESNCRTRNVFYILTAVFSAGLGISIKF